MVSNDGFYKSMFNKFNFDTAVKTCFDFASWDIDNFIDGRINLFKKIDSIKNDGFIPIDTSYKNMTICYDIVYEQIEKEIYKLQSKPINYGE